MIFLQEHDQGISLWSLQTLTSFSLQSKNQIMDKSKVQFFQQKTNKKKQTILTKTMLLLERLNRGPGHLSPAITKPNKKKPKFNIKANYTRPTPETQSKTSPGHKKSKKSKKIRIKEDNFHIPRWQKLIFWVLFVCLLKNQEREGSKRQYI